MTVLALGSLCTGYGGLDLAAEQLLGARTVWCAEFEDAPSRVIAARYPDVPNVHDVTRIPWHIMAPIDVMTAGYPCQPFSLAGARKGKDDERHLWPSIAEGIRIMRPRHVLLENVRGHLSLGFDQVLHDLNAMGYAAVWRILAASEIGACHQRQRLFIYAQPAEHVANQGTEPVALAGATGWLDPVADLFGGRAPWIAKESMPQAGVMRDGAIFPVAMPRGGDVGGPLFPTPDASVANDGEGPATWLARREKVRARGINGNGMGMPLTIAVQLLPTPQAKLSGSGPDYAREGRATSGGTDLTTAVALLPTPKAGDAIMGLPRTSGRPVEKSTHLATRIVYDLPSIDDALLPTPRASRGASATEIAYALGGQRVDDDRTQGEVVFIRPAEWGKYAAAVNRHARMLDRRPPSPTEANSKGNPNLAPAFVEWMMCLEPGRVTSPALWAHLSAKQAREAQLKMLGNGVVPIQALHAYRSLRALAERRREVIAA